QVAIVQSMVKDLAFDPRRDLAPVALVGVIPNVLVAGPRTPAKTLAELLELARRNPGKMNYSSTGAGTSVHLSAELLKYYAGVDDCTPRWRRRHHGRLGAALAAAYPRRQGARPRRDQRAARAAAARGADDDRVGISGLRDQRLVGRRDHRRHAGRNHRAARSGNQALARAAAGRRGL